MDGKAYEEGSVGPYLPLISQLKIFVHCRPLKTKKKLHSTASLNLKNGKAVHRTIIHGKSSTIKVCRKLSVVKLRDPSKSTHD